MCAGAGNNTITGGSGGEIFVLPGAGGGFDAISGFTETNGDVLNLRAALAGTNWNWQAATLGNYVKVTDVGNNTDISIASKGTGSGVLVASSPTRPGSASPTSSATTPSRHRRTHIRRRSGAG